MNKKSLKPIMLSALSALAFGAVGAGATFALFTDKAETTVSVAAGVIDIDSDVTIAAVSSLNANDQGNAILNNGLNATFCNGGSAEVTTDASGKQTLTVSQFTPGDSITLRLAVKNKSTVLSKWRIRMVDDGSILAKHLVNDFGGAEAGWQDAQISSDPTNGEQLAAKLVTITLPNTDNIITEREQGSDNPYQELEATFTLYAEAVQGNAKVDNRIVVSSYAKDEAKKLDGGTTLFDPVTGQTTFEVHKDQVTNALLNGVNLRYAVDDQGKLVTDPFGYVSMRNDTYANYCDWKSAIDGSKDIFLPYGTINEQLVDGFSGFDHSNEHLNLKYADGSGYHVYGATRLVQGNIENATTIDFAGHGYHSGKTHYAMGFSGTSTNKLVAGINNINFVSSVNTSNVQNIEQGYNSQSMFFFSEAEVEFKDCNIDAVNFEKNAITRDVFDLRNGANVTVKNCDVETYGMGAYFQNIGICTQTLLLVNTQNNVSNFLMEGGNVRFSNELQNHVYHFGNDDYALATLSQYSDFQHKLVSFYQSNAPEQQLIPAECSYAFQGVSFYDGSSTAAYALNAADVSVSALADYANLVSIA